MNETTKDFLDEFFEEFQYRIDALAAHNDKGVRKELLFLLVENLILKYENRLQQQKKGLLAKLFPFISSNGEYDAEFEKQINQQIDTLISDGEHTDALINGNVNNTLGNNFNDVAKNAKKTEIEGYLPKSDHNNIDEASTNSVKINNYSKTNIPVNIDIALELDLLPTKEQDHLDYFVLPNGTSGIILCDGVSGDGEYSAELAQLLPKHVINYLKINFESDITLKSWKNLVVKSIEHALENYNFDKGASTLLLMIVDPESDQIYVSWMGDGNLIYFNESMTGFSKLLTPHNDTKGRLTRAVTAEGLLGEPSVQILSGSGGSLIVSSDGYNLANGRILRHFFQKVLRSKDINNGLQEWTNESCCEDPKLHPEATDDRSIGVIRWNTVFNQYNQNDLNDHPSGKIEESV